MRQARPVALVCAGQVSRGVLARLPRLAQHLGPVKADTFRSASRTANALHAGSPVPNYESLEPSELVLIAVPPDLIERTVRELRDSAIGWKGKAVVALEPRCSAAVLSSLEALGAATAVLHTVGRPEDQRLVTEGHSGARKLIRSLLTGPSGSLIQLAPNASDEFLSAISEASEAVVSIIGAATMRIRNAGLSKTHAEDLVAVVAANAMQSYFRAGERALRVTPPKEQRER